MAKKKNVLDRVVRGVERMDKDTRKGVNAALRTEKKKKNGAKAQAKRNQRHIEALTEQVGQLAQQVSTLTSTVAERRKDSAADR
ncbi:hypothetical protein ACFYWU_16245 [Streptomyces chrestomyceticus]|uniref:hypothetical protein n=1 Tax=Streptomyces chrestomyceticus TaxID=68185 RepID=UPI0019D24571|nr:hypothetical protein [Streptomyces chrestomyceticus]